MWIPRWFKWLNDSLRSESRAIQDALKEQGNAITINSETSKNEQKEAARIIARAIDNASDTAANYERPQRHNEYRLQKLGVFLTALAAGGAITAAIASWWAIPEIKKSADAAKCAADTATSQMKLYRQQLVDTMGASIDQEFPQPEKLQPDLKLLNYTGIGLLFRNVGKVDAIDFHAKGKMIRLRYPRFTLVGNPEVAVSGQPERIRPMQADSTPNPYVRLGSLRFNTYAFSGTDLRLIASTQEVVQVEGVFGYDDGFGNQRVGSFCYMYLDIPHYALGANSTPTDSAGWQVCEDARNLLTHYERWRGKP